jgi:CheY-like chemotaxis protein
MAIVQRVCPRDEERLTTKILLVEDDKDSPRCLAIRLKATGYAAVVVQDAISAVAYRPKRERPDLIVLDLALPWRQRYAVLERLRTIPSLVGTPVVLTARDPGAAK